MYALQCRIRICPVLVENVNSFLSGIRATFRQDNVIVTSGLKLKPKNPNDESEK